MNTYQRIAGTAACLLASLSVAACSSSGGNGPAKLSADVQSPAAAPAVSADALANQSVADLKAATSVHLKGSVDSHGQKIAFDLELVRGKGCTGSVNAAAKGSVELILIGRKMWLKPSPAFWKKAGLSASAIARLGGHWIGTTESSKAFGESAAFCDLQTMAGNLENSSGLTRGAVTTIDGRSAVALKDPSDKGMAYVTEGAQPILLRIAQGGTGSGYLDFLDYNKPVTIAAPSDALTIPGSKLGM